MYRTKPTLTVQELQAAYLATYDLGPGYPQLDVPDYVRRLYLNDTIDDLSLRFSPFWTPEKQALLDVELDSAVRNFLRIPRSLRHAIRATFSGSIALDRAITAAFNLARQKGSQSITVVTTTPCIDIMRLLLQERAGVTPYFVPSDSNGVFGALDPHLLIDSIQHARGSDKSHAVSVLLSSPENPTGATWSAEEIKEIARACARCGATLIMDHCFAVAGLHDAARLARIWDFDDLECDWIAVWDTGKTFGLNEDKLGFIICGNVATKTAVDASLAVLQFGVARHSKLFFAELLRQAFYYGHAQELRALCHSNLAIAKKYSGDFFRVRHTEAGSLLLLDIAPTGKSDEEIRELLLRAGVGVVAGNVFFHSGWQPSSYIRVALARHTEYFETAMDRIVTVLK